MAALLSLGIVVLGIYLFRLSRANVVSVDPAYVLLQAEDLLHGNWLLHGWVLPPNSLRFTETLVYAVGIAIFGLTPALFYLVPVAVCLALIVALVMAATAGLSTAPALYVVAALPILPIVFPSPAMRAQVLMGPFHTATTVIALVSMVALYHAHGEAAPGRRRVLTYLAFFLLAAAAMSDPYITIMALGPIAGVSLTRVVACRDFGERRGYAPALSAMCSGLHISVSATVFSCSSWPALCWPAGFPAPSGPVAGRSSPRYSDLRCGRSYPRRLRCG